MKRIFIVALVALLSQLTAVQAQEHSYGVGLGISNFLGDLGKNAPKGRLYYRDIQASLFRPAGGVYYRYAFHERLAAKAAINVGWLEGNDKFAGPTEEFSDDWFRYYRNLHFRSHVLELAVTGEFNILPYKLGSVRDRFTPHVFIGGGIFHFSPRAKYKGEWVRLRPLGTEGQNLPEYPDRKKYSTVQPNMMVGFGLKYNINRNISINLEIGHRYTFTDYIDDVSTNYPDPEHIYEHYDPETADMVHALSNRSQELDPEGHHANITAPEMQRGNPDSKDGYVMSQVSLNFKIDTRKRRYRFKRTRWGRR